LPVRTAGPRLYRSVKFQHLVHGAAGGHGPKASNIALNLTPFVDMMTILVTFLLMVFSSTGEILQAQKGLDLPLADSRDILQQAPVIIVTKTEITYQGQLIATTESVMRDDSPTQVIDALAERLDAAAKKIKEDVALGKVPPAVKKVCDDMKNGIKPQPGKQGCPDGLAILQADQSTDVRLINKVVNTAKVAGFGNLLFAVKNK
jgi:biopolymer transport protein ExbD